MNRRTDQRGFAMLEVMLAIGLFAVVAGGLSAVTVGSVRANNISKQTAVAAALIQNRIERFRTFDPAVSSADLTPGTHQDPLNPMTPLGVGNGTYSRSWVVTASTPKVGLSQVAVTVTWTGSSTRTVTGVTYVCVTANCG
jgi:prepilin-type N-terminal cleavage/methylation domain-containing protein